jgi:hypothetical protein
MFFLYIILVHPTVFRTALCTATFSLLAMVVWFFFVWVNMAPICATFYHIKYPQLIQVFHLTGLFNCLMTTALILYECCVFCVLDDEDPIISTSIFYKQNEEWVPPLFEKPQIRTYKEGVNNWSSSVEQRCAQLQTTLSRAETIMNNSRNQSGLLRQVTNLVVETETQVTKTAKLMEQQDQLITAFKSDFEGVKLHLDEIENNQSPGFAICTQKDLCLWSCIAFGCLAIFVCLNFALTKWASAFGLSLPEVP